MSILKRLGVPVFYAEGIPAVTERASWSLTVDGLVKAAPQRYSFAEIEALPLTTVNARLTSVSGWSVRCNWQGVRFSDLLARLELLPGASHGLFASAGGYTTSLPLTALSYEKVLLCYRVDDEYLEPEYGGPLRLLVPQLWGYKSVKGLQTITFTSRSVPGWWESRGYSDDAQIEPGVTFDINTRMRRPIPGGEVTSF